MWLISINQVYFSNLNPICFHVYFFFVAGGFEQPSGMEKQGSQFSDTMRHMSNILETTFGMINQMVLFGFCFCLDFVFVWFCFCFVQLGLHVFCISGLLTIQSGMMSRRVIQQFWSRWLPIRSPDSSWDRQATQLQFKGFRVGFPQPQINIRMHMSFTISANN